MEVLSARGSERRRQPSTASSEIGMYMYVSISTIATIAGSYFKCYIQVNYIFTLYSVVLSIILF